MQLLEYNYKKHVAKLWVVVIHKVYVLLLLCVGCILLHELTHMEFDPPFRFGPHTRIPSSQLLTCSAAFMLYGVFSMTLTATSTAKCFVYFNPFIVVSVAKKNNANCKNGLKKALLLCGTTHSLLQVAHSLSRVLTLGKNGMCSEMAYDHTPSLVDNIHLV